MRSGRKRERKDDCGHEFHGALLRGLMRRMRSAADMALPVLGATAPGRYANCCGLIFRNGGGANFSKSRQIPGSLPSLRAASALDAQKWTGLSPLLQHRDLTERHLKWL